LNYYKSLGKKIPLAYKQAIYQEKLIMKFKEFINEEYAGQKKVFNDIDKKLKSEKSKEKSNKKKSEQQKLYYYLKYLKKNKKS
jgi:hypothetical protein